MKRATVLITDYDLPGSAAYDSLIDAGFIVCRAEGPTAEAIIAAGIDADALLVQWARITPEILDALPKVRFISRMGIGYDMIDVDAATERGVAVANTAAYCLEEVASHSIAMIMALGRGLFDYDACVRRGKWAATNATPMAVRPSSTTIGVVGFGKIGSIVAKSCAALGYRVIVADPFVPIKTVQDAGVSAGSFDEVLAASDMITLHIPLTAETQHLIDKKALASMRPGSVVINTCRGALIDEDALVESLRLGHTAGAGIDVFALEPLPETSPLREVDGVLLSPHAAWYSPQSLADLPVHAAQNVIDFLGGNLEGAIVNPGFQEWTPRTTPRAGARGVP